MKETTPKTGGRKKLLWAVIALIAVYLASYAVLSFTGGVVVFESGELRTVGEDNISLAQADLFVWLPRYGFYRKLRQSDGTDVIHRDFLGGVFAPMILLDQSVIHPTIRFRDAKGELLKPLPAPPFSKYHPLLANHFYGRWPYEPAAEQP